MMRVLCRSADLLIGELTENGIIFFDKEDRWFQLARDEFHEDPEAFLVAVYDVAKTSISAMALGSVTTGTLDNGLFVDGLAGQAAVSALSAGTSGGVTASRLAKLFSISQEDADQTLAVKTQLNRQSGDSTLLRIFGTMTGCYDTGESSRSSSRT
jgi:hypothetical protein